MYYARAGEKNWTLRRSQAGKPSAATTVMNQMELSRGFSDDVA
jgi:hypothetical protein